MSGVQTFRRPTTLLAILRRFSVTPDSAGGTCVMCVECGNCQYSPKGATLEQMVDATLVHWHTCGEQT